MINSTVSDNTSENEANVIFSNTLYRTVNIPLADKKNNIQKLLVILKTILLPYHGFNSLI